MNKIIYLMVVFSFFNAKNVSVANDVSTPIVLELFTSQSCSSCPSADRILEKLATENNNIIALSCNVTYWNHLDWQDTLSQEFCNTRQRHYVRSLKSRGPYTPQIVINGRETMVGSKGHKIKRVIANQPPLKTIKLSLNDNNLSITLPETPSTDSYALTLLSYGQTHEENILKGENSGRIVSYTNPIKNIVSLGTWDGTRKTMIYDISKLKKAQGYSVLVQKNGRTGNIIAAGKIEF